MEPNSWQCDNNFSMEIGQPQWKNSYQETPREWRDNEWYEIEDSKLDSLLERLSEHSTCIKNIEEVIVQINQTAKNTQASFHNMEIQIG